MKSLLFLILSLSTIFLHGQKINKVFIIGNVNSKSLDQITLQKCGLKDLPPINLRTNLPLNKKNEFSEEIPVAEKSFYLLLDGYGGHKIFLGDDDTVYIQLTQKPKKSNDFGTFNNMKVKARYSGNYTFFDNISVFFGYKRIYNPFRFDARRFKNTCDSAYHAALKILAGYQKKGIVSEDFIKFAKAELLSMYIYKLFEPLAVTKKDKLPKDFFRIVENQADFSSIEFAENLPTYADAGYLYNMYFLNNFNPEVWFTNFNEEFSSGYKNFRGPIRDMILGWCIVDYKDKEFATFDSLYNVFLHICSTKSIKERVKNTIDEYLLKQKLKPSLDQVINNTKFYDKNGKIVLLKNLTMRKKIVVFDIWASWCEPCKKQLPYSLKSEKKFANNVDFIYVSIDNDRGQWLKAISKLGLQNSNNYLLAEGFDSEFRQYFDLASIPRYILFDLKNEKVIHKNLPLPELKGFNYYVEKSVLNH